ncbi:MAG: OmpA family protein [Geminicoccaceae bacterium]
MKNRTIAHLSWNDARKASRVVAMGLAILSLSLPIPASAGDKSKLLTEVHFDPGSAEVTLGGRHKIQVAIAAIKKQNPREIHVVGFTDSTGEEQLNRVIARKRADNVASLLAKHGITAPLVIEGKGETGAPYKTPNDVSEPLNRCVGIIAVGEAKQKTPL